MTRSIARALPTPDCNLYPPCLTLRHYRQKYKISTNLLAILTSIEAAEGRSFIALVREGFRAPIDQAWISNAENGHKMVNPKNRRLLAAVISKFEGRHIEPSELFPEYDNMPGLQPIAPSPMPSIFDLF